jgi:hypothetical protein
MQVEVFVHCELLDPVIGNDGRRSDHVDSNVNVAARDLGIGTGPVRGVRHRQCNAALQTRQADIETGAEEIGVARQVQVDLRVDREVGRKSDLILRAAIAIALSKQADQPAASNCSRFVPIRAEP